MEVSQNGKKLIGVMDSGVGGIAVLSALYQRMPSQSFIYLADKSGAPYGNRGADYILERTAKCCELLRSKGATAIVIACNTATCVAVSKLRQLDRGFIYVGLEPAIKPAIHQTKSGNILVLLTPAAASQQKFLSLLSSFSCQRVVVSPQPSLASMIEASLTHYSKSQLMELAHGGGIAFGQEYIQLSAYLHSLLSKYTSVSAIVLGCTHYLFCRQIISDYYGGDIKIFDGNKGAVDRLQSILRQNPIHDCYHNKGQGLDPTIGDGLPQGAGYEGQNQRPGSIQFLEM